MSNSVGVLVGLLRARQAEIARAISAEVRRVAPDTAAGRDPSYQAGLLPAVDAVLSYSLDVIERGPGWSGPIPVEAAEQARRAARAGVALGVVLRRYVAGHGLLGEFVAEETARLGLASDPAALKHISSTHDALLGHFTAGVEDVHNQERQRMERSPEQRRVDLVRRHLGGEDVGEIELAGLRYQFDGWHVGMIAVGPRARDVFEKLKDRQLLLVGDGERTVWAWIGGRRRLTHPEMNRFLLENEIAGGAIAVGEPAHGLEGWRQTHRQAQHALRVALVSPQARARYADVALLLPWLVDPERGRALVELYLSSLSGQKDGGAVLRQTLRIYFECRTASAAARKLRIDRRTLAHRLTTIETAVGYKLDSRRAELEVALRLHDMLTQAGLRTVVQNPSLGFPTLA